MTDQLLYSQPSFDITLVPHNGWGLQKVKLWE